MNVTRDFYVQQATDDNPVATMFQGAVIGIDIGDRSVREYYIELLNNVKNVKPEFFEELLRGIVMGIDIGASSHPVSAPTTRRPSVRSTDADVIVYAFRDPRDDNYFYVGSAQDPAKQLHDYTKSTNDKISCVPVIREIVAAGHEVGVEEFTTVPQSEASDAKRALIEELRDKGNKLVNQRL